MKGLKVLIAGIILFSILEGIVLAQGIPEVAQDEEVSAQDLGISEPKVLPDNPFYFLKNFFARGIQLFFTFNRVKKGELRLKFANEKLFEAKKLVELKRNPKAIEKVLASFENDIDEISKLSGEELKQFSEKLVHQQLLHQKILQRLETQVPAEVFEKIKANRERHLERFKDVMLKLESREKIADRLESDLGKIKGSKFKEFKDLESLDEIEEKMPEDVKKRIEEKRAEITEKFREKLEGMSDEEKEKFKTYLEQIPGNKLKHLEIISNLEANEISDKLSDALEKAKEKKVEEVAEEEKAISADVAQNQIKKAEDEIAKAEEKAKEISEVEYGGRAARRLLDLAKTHLDEAKKAFDEGKNGRAFGLATAAYHEALNGQRLVVKIEEIKKSPEKMREKFEKIYPGVELPEDVTKCEIPLMKKCAEGEVLRVEKTEEGCPVFKCESIPKKPGAEKPEVCIQVWDPVCGKDGKTYSNECFAKVAGVEIDYEGVCGKYACPKQKVIDCMPIVPPERIRYCGGPYHEWIKENCPDVGFTW